MGAQHAFRHPTTLRILMRIAPLPNHSECAKREGEIANQILLVVYKFRMRLLVTKNTILHYHSGQCTQINLQICEVTLSLQQGRKSKPGGAPHCEKSRVFFCVTTCTTADELSCRCRAVCRLPMSFSCRFFGQPTNRRRAQSEHRPIRQVHSAGTANCPTLPLAPVVVDTHKSFAHCKYPGRRLVQSHKRVLYYISRGPFSNQLTY